jgi:hypothetical protein
MNTAGKHYKIINSRTGNIIHYCSLDVHLAAEEVKIELDKIRAQVATKNGLSVDTIYSEEIKVEE